MRAWGVPRRKIDATKLAHALLMVAADLEREANRDNKKGEGKRL